MDNLLGLVRNLFFKLSDLLFKRGYSERVPRP
jgi:hypothetical protein